MNIYLRGNPRTYADLSMTTGKNSVSSEQFSRISADPKFREAVTSGLIRLPEGISLPEAPKTETAAERKLREKAEATPKPLEDSTPAA